MIVQPMSLEEVKKVLESFAKDKIPVPDGWIVEFLKDFFDLLGHEILATMEESR